MSAIALSRARQRGFDAGDGGRVGSQIAALRQLQFGRGGYTLISPTFLWQPSARPTRRSPTIIWQQPDSPIGPRLMREIGFGTSGCARDGGSSSRWARPARRTCGFALHLGKGANSLRFRAGIPPALAPASRPAFSASALSGSPRSRRERTARAPSVPTPSPDLQILPPTSSTIRRLAFALRASNVESLRSNDHRALTAPPRDCDRIRHQLANWSARRWWSDRARRIRASGAPQSHGAHATPPNGGLFPVRRDISKGGSAASLRMASSH